ncbi:MAG: tetratricopeptide repeat protein [Hyphomicrobiales bacterium]
MTNETTSDGLTAEERLRLRKQMTDQAVKLAVSSRWEEAVSVNREFLRVFGEEAEALNRLGKALSEVGQVSEARKAYGRAIELDPSNTIARRNLDRLASMNDSVPAGMAPSQLDTRLFVEETGKATVATLQAVDETQAALLDAGDVVELELQGNAVNVKTKGGAYIGMVEPRIGLRLNKMMTAGNQYTAAMVTTVGNLRVMIRETYQHPSQIGRVSFPQARATDFRAYTRRGLLRGQDESEFDEDDYEEDETEESWTDTGDDMDTGGLGVDIATDDESFD